MRDTAHRLQAYDLLHLNLTQTFSTVSLWVDDRVGRHDLDTILLRQVPGGQSASRSTSQPTDPRFYFPIWLPVVPQRRG